MLRLESIANYARCAWQRHDAGALALAGAVVGVGSHLLYWMHGLRTPQAARICWSHAAAFALTFAFCVWSHGALFGLQAAGAFCGSYMAGVFGSMTIYRLFFHRLRRFPGPVSAKITLMHGWFRDRYQSHERLVRWCDQYGDIVRIGNREPKVLWPLIRDGSLVDKICVPGPMDLVLRSADAVQKTQGLTSACSKRGSGIFESFEYEGSYSLEALIDNAAHRRRRQIWDRAQNSKGKDNSSTMTGILEADLGCKT